MPAEASEAAAEGAGDLRWKKCLNVVEASGFGVGADGFVQRKEIVPALPRRAGGGIVQQVRLSREAQESGHYDAPVRGVSIVIGR